jgi:hypothetical protein
MLERLRSDVLTATRSLIATPMPVLGAIITLAVAVGVNLAVFGLIDRALLSPPSHVVAPERLFTIAIDPPGASPGAAPMTTTSYVAFETIRDRVPAVRGAAAFSRNDTSIVVNGEQQEVRSMTISPTSTSSSSACRRCSARAFSPAWIRSRRRRHRR